MIVTMRLMNDGNAWCFWWLFHDTLLFLSEAFFVSFFSFFCEMVRSWFSLHANRCNCSSGRKVIGRINQVDPWSSLWNIENRDHRIVKSLSYCRLHKSWENLSFSEGFNFSEGFSEGFPQGFKIFPDEEKERKKGETQALPGPATTPGTALRISEQLERS